MYKNSYNCGHSKLTRMKQQVRNLEAERSKLLRSGKYMQAIKLAQDIEKAIKLIEDEEKYAPKPLKELVSPEKAKEAVALIVECHLAADYLTATAYALKDWFKLQQLVAVSVIPELNDIIKLSESFASSICKVNDNLSNLMTDNDTLIEAMHKKTLSYIKQRLK